jgi:hypothetical protein
MQLLEAVFSMLSAATATSHYKIAAARISYAGQYGGTEEADIINEL